MVAPGYSSWNGLAIPAFILSETEQFLDSGSEWRAPFAGNDIVPWIGALDAQSDLMKARPPDPGIPGEFQKDIISLTPLHAVEPYPEYLEIVPPGNLLDLLCGVMNQRLDDSGDMRRQSMPLLVKNAPLTWLSAMRRVAECLASPPCSSGKNIGSQLLRSAAAYPRSSTPPWQSHALPDAKHHIGLRDGPASNWPP